MKLVISDPKTGKTYQAELEKGRESLVVGKKMGETLDGGSFGAAGYSFEITGGSDTRGLPRRMDISGARKLEILMTDGTGFRAERKGERRKKVVRGNTVTDDSAQINMKVIHAGPTAL